MHFFSIIHVYDWSMQTKTCKIKIPTTIDYEHSKSLFVTFENNIHNVRIYNCVLEQQIYIIVSFIQEQLQTSYNKLERGSIHDSREMKTAHCHFFNDDSDSDPKNFFNVYLCCGIISKQGVLVIWFTIFRCKEHILLISRTIK